MPEIRIVIVGPKYEGNVGAIARSMANFDLKELYLVNPCELGDDAYRRSKHGSSILDDVHIVDTLDEAVKDCFMVVGVSGVTTKGDRNYTRVPVPVREFAEHCRGYPERIAVVFGREDIGLLQDELNMCDVLIHIPTGDEYPIMNLSHAANIVMYEFFQAEAEPHRPEPADHREKELMFDFFGDLLDAIEYPEPQGIDHGHVQKDDGACDPHQVRVQHDHGDPRGRVEVHHVREALEERLIIRRDGLP